MAVGLQAAIGAVGGGVVAAATVGAARALDSGPGERVGHPLALPIGAAGVGVAALVLGAGRGGAGRSLLLGAGTGALLGAAGAMLLAARARGTAGATTPSAGTAPSAPPAGSPSASAPASPSPSSSPASSPAASPAAPPASASPVPASPAAESAAPAAPAPAPPAPAPPAAKPAPAAAKPAPAAAKPAPAAAPLLKVGSTGPAVAALQSRLAELGYAVDSGGTYTRATRDAVMAFQKVNGLARDGIAGGQTQAALKQPRQPQLGSGKPNRIDVDLSSQTMVVVRNNKIAYIVNATSGNPNHRDGKGIATPTGTFSVQRKIAGTRHAPLGDLYYPSYFRGGVAVHGSNSVVAERDSHGCVRVPRWIERRVFQDMPVGSQVVVHE